VTLRPRLLAATDRILAALVGSIVLGATLAFGGAVWWARPALATLVSLLVLAWLLRILLQGSWRLLKSPLAPLGALAVLLGVVQLAPLPAPWAETLSPRSRAVHALGALPGLVAADDESATPPESEARRTPATLDRGATLRWVVGATACLALFCVVAHFADRLGHALVVWGSVVAGFFLNTVFGLVQLVGPTSGLYGFLEPGQGPTWTPSRADLLSAPGTTVLRLVGESATGREGWALEQPERPFAFGTLMGGPGAYLALAALALPLALALTLQAWAPRGSREGVWARLSQTGQGGLVVFLTLLTMAGALLVGLLAGPWLSVPFAVGLALAGLPGARASGLRWLAAGITAGTLALLALGAGLGTVVGLPTGPAPLADRVARAEAREVWSDSARIARDFPVLGTGMGSFAAIYPYYKGRDASPTTARSSVLQWGVEAGAAGLVLLGLGGLWCLTRLPGAVRRVGTADRALAFGLVGAAGCFAMVSAVHWTVELAGVALAACAVAGTWNRWLAGGTDLFVARA
jgi:hypothetical protein